MWRERLIVAVVLGGLVLSLLTLMWRENERRYTALTMTGCFGDASPALGGPQECTGVRRLCRDAPPLVDWRHFCR